MIKDVLDTPLLKLFVDMACDGSSLFVCVADE